MGVVGRDTNGRKFLDLMEEAGFSPSGIIIDRDRSTTVKTRVIAHAQHVVRVDRETKKEVTPKIQEQVLGLLRKQIDSIDSMIIEDYNKGTIAKDLIPQLISLANTNGIIITVDPKFDNFFEFRHVTSFKPNRKEVEETLGMKVTDDGSAEEAGRKILDRLRAKSVLLTRGEKGMSLFEEDGSVPHVTTRARRVADVSGAGDTVISTLTIALAAGATFKEATTIASYAGGVVCGEVGIVPVDREALYESLLGRTNRKSSRQGNQTRGG